MKNFNLNAADWPKAFDKIQQNSGHVFQDPGKLRLALTHSSYAAESNVPSCPWNERLEFLGDAVLQLVITERLFQDMPTLQEGELTRARSVLVDEPANARNARLLELDRALLLGKGECQTGGRERPALLGDAFEAFLGAVYLDGGYPAAKAVIGRVYPDVVSSVRSAEESDNPKGVLQQHCQALFRKSPDYRSVSVEGPVHAPRFVVEVLLPDGRAFSGEGNSKKSAEQNAAKAALEDIREKDASAPAPASPEA